MKALKRVHFAPTDSVYSFTPLTPDPTYWTSLGLSPTPKPLTASSLHSDSFGVKALQTPQAHSPILLHYLLAFSHVPQINYDISLPPTVIPWYYPPEMLVEPATSPPLPSLTIQLPIGQWPIEVRPSHGSVVKVWDVLQSIYGHLRHAVRPEEYDALPSNETRKRVSAAYATRFLRHMDAELRREEEQKGLKRIDFLLGMNRFLGLASPRIASNVWDLVVSA